MIHFHLKQLEKRTKLGNFLHDVTEARVGNCKVKVGIEFLYAYLFGFFLKKRTVTDDEN